MALCFDRSGGAEEAVGENRKEERLRDMRNGEEKMSGGW